MVVAESDCAEDKGENDSHETDIAQLDDVDTNGFENVTNLWDVAEDIHYVQEVDGGIEESSEEGNEHINQYSVELTSSVQRLSCITSSQCFQNQLQSYVDLRLAGYHLNKVLYLQHVLIRCFLRIL